MRSVFFQDAEGQQACALRAVNAFAEVGGGQFLPVDGELWWRDRLRSGHFRHNRKQEREQNGKDRGAGAGRHLKILLAANLSMQRKPGSLAALGKTMSR